MHKKENIEALRPKPIIEDLDLVAYEKGMQTSYAVEALLEGYYVLILDFYSSGLEILNALKKQLHKENDKQSDYQNQRENRALFRQLSHKLLIEVSDHQLSVKKAPNIGWFKILYPELQEFLLPFPEVQGLNSAWQWYIKGIKIPVLKQVLFPWYASYFPTRFEHLELFDEWLKNYNGEKQSAIDLGAGSGVLSLQMLQYGFRKIYATDNNPNAIIGLQELKERQNITNELELYYGDFFSSLEVTSELIVFNPPWLPKTRDVQGIDAAMYYDDNLFHQFFQQAPNYMDKDGVLVLLFSNLASLTHKDIEHPIRKELEQGGRFKKEELLFKEVKKASNKTRRDAQWRQKEKVELWVLKKI